MDELKKPAARINPTVSATSIDCEQCGQPMILKFTTLRLTGSGKVRVYQCADCERLAFIPEPPVVPQDTPQGTSQGTS